MNGFYIYAHDHTKLTSTLDIVNNALDDLELHHKRKTFDEYSIT
jgi:hypothetical protein